MEGRTHQGADKVPRAHDHSRLGAASRDPVAALLPPPLPPASLPVVAARQQSKPPRQLTRGEGGGGEPRGRGWGRVGTGDWGGVPDRFSIKSPFSFSFFGAGKFVFFAGRYGVSSYMSTIPIFREKNDNASRKKVMLFQKK